MDVLQITICIIIALTILTVVPVMIFVAREISKSYHFFSGLAARYHGRVTKFPLGTVIPLADGTSCRVYAMQGTIRFEGRVRLSENPGVLIIRRFPYFRGLIKLARCPGRSIVSLDGPFEKRYFSQAANEAWLRELLSADILHRMSMLSGLARLEIKKTKMVAILILWKMTEDEQRRAYDTIDFLFCLLEKVVRSRLAEGR